MKIGGSEGTRRVTGMLLMTLGLVEVVKLAHPQEWVTFLDKESYLPLIQPRAETLLQQAQYKSHEFGRGEIYFHGEVPGLPDVSGYGDTLVECQHDLAEAVKTRLLLRLARRQPWPE